MKNYLLEVAEIGNDLEEQDAIEWAVYSNHVRLTWDLEKDRAAVKRRLPEIVELFRRRVREYSQRRAA